MSLKRNFFGQRVAASLAMSLLASTLVACGGGGGSSGGGGASVATYSGSTSQATVTEENKDEAARISIEGSVAAIGNESSDDIPFAAELTADSALLGDDAVERLKQLVLTLAEQLADGQDMVTAVTTSQPGECGGKVESTSNGDFSKITMVFKNYCVSDVDGQYLFSGKVISSFHDDGGFESQYQNFTVTYPDGSKETIDNMTVSCDGQYTCTVTADFKGSDGEIYRIENVSVVDYGDGSYDVTARVYDKELGYVDMEARGIVLCGEGISAGTITLISAGESGEDVQITFTGCNVYTVNILYGV